MPEVDPNDAVAARSEASEEIMAAAELPRTLMGGTDAMRAAREVYLPAWPLETPESYTARLDSSFLFNAYKRAWSTLVGKAFDQPIKLSPDVPAAIVGYCENVDLTGQHLDVFAKHVFGDSLHPGGGHILVDFPAIPENSTLDDELRAGSRPYWTYIPAERVLGWRSERRAGIQTLTQVRIEEDTIEPDGAWGETEKSRVRVFYAADDESEHARYELYERTVTRERGRRARWEKVGYGPLAPLTQIPLATFYANRCGFMTFDPALRELAEKNLEHWQSASDQRASLHYDRVCIYHFRGFDEKEMSASQAWGPGVRLASSDPSSQVSVVSRDGGGTEVGERDLDRIKAEMQTLSLEPLMPQSGDVTATARAIDEARVNSQLGAWVRNFSDTLEVALNFTAQWVGAKKGGGSVVMSSDFSLPIAAKDEMDAIKDIGLSDETLWLAADARRLMPEDWTVELERARLDAQPPALAAVPPIPFPAAETATDEGDDEGAEEMAPQLEDGGEAA